MNVQNCLKLKVYQRGDTSIFGASLYVACTPPNPTSVGPAGRAVGRSRQRVPRSVDGSAALCWRVAPCEAAALQGGQGGAAQADLPPQMRAVSLPAPQLFPCICTFPKTCSSLTRTRFKGFLLCSKNVGPRRDRFSLRLEGSVPLPCLSPREHRRGSTGHAWKGGLS